MGSAGPKFTWNNGRQGRANIQKRLDRGLCNEEWNALFPEGMVQTLPRTYSDHDPILILIHGHTVPGRVNRPFQMEAAWFTNPTFENVIVNAWTGNSILIVLKILLQLLLCGINKNLEIFLDGKDGSWLD